MFNRYFQFDQVFIDPETKTVICMTPKVMTKFIRQTLRDGYRLFHGRRHASAGRYRFAPISKRFPLAPPGGYLDAARNPARYQAFGFVRNPYWRLHSAWRNKLHDPFVAIEAGERAHFPPSIRFAHLPQLRAFAAARRLPGAKPGELVPFGVFVRFAAARPDWLRNRHWRSQGLMLQIGHFPGMRLFPVETALSEGALEMFPRLGFREGWVRRRLRNRRNASSAFAATPYDEETAALVFAAFRADFDAFGYDPESWRTPE